MEHACLVGQSRAANYAHEEVIRDVNGIAYHYALEKERRILLIPASVCFDRVRMDPRDAR